MHRGRRLTSTSVALLVVMACQGSDVAEPPPVPGVADTTSIVVDNTTAYQTIDGFGGTTLTLVYPGGDYLGPYRAAAIQAAYGSVGVSLGMLNIGVVETPANATDLWAQRANDNGDPSLAEPSGFNFTGSDILRDVILTPAAAFGYSGLELGQLVDLRGPLSWLGPVREADYERYLDEVAEHVLVVMQRWRDAYGVTPRLLDLFNEPTSGNRELGSNSVQEVVDIVKRVGDRLRGAGFSSVKFIVPNEETVGRSLEVAHAILSDPGALPFVGVIGYHPYPYGSAYASPGRILAASGNGTPDPEATQEMERLKALGQQYNVPIWLTEVSEGPANNEYSFDAMENVLARAIHVHDNFEYAGASAYFGSTTIWDSRSHAEHFAGRDVPFSSESSSLVLVDVGTGEIKISGMGYAVGHYARWVKPGAVRLRATSNSPRVLVTAFREQAKRLVVVTVNDKTTAQLLRIALTGASTAGGVTGEMSYEGVRWRPIPPFAATAAGEVELVVPARSVATLVIPTR